MFFLTSLGTTGLDNHENPIRLSPHDTGIGNRNNRRYVNNDMIVRFHIFNLPQITLKPQKRFRENLECAEYHPDYKLASLSNRA